MPCPEAETRPGASIPAQLVLGAIPRVRNPQIASNRISSQVAHMTIFANMTLHLPFAFSYGHVRLYQLETGQALPHLGLGENKAKPDMPSEYKANCLAC
jgi:hypothetical protein